MSNLLFAAAIIGTLPLSLPAEEDAKNQPAGSVKHVDPETQTVWINLGAKDGLKKRTTFQILEAKKEGAVNGQIEVVRILGPHLAEARILKQDPKSPIQKGNWIQAEKK